jgi:radical SAM protein with 4Fe4S-binding SPASM domain
MKNDRLKPYVHKVKGAANYALYDLFNGHFYRLRPKGDIQQLRESLKKAGLIFETEGEVPFKLELDLSEETENVRIRELQVKLNGKKEDTCWQRNPVTDTRFKMEAAILESLEKRLEHLPVETVRIEAEEFDGAGIETILGTYKCRAAVLHVKNEPDKAAAMKLQGICKDRNIHLDIHTNGKYPMDKLVIKPPYFFYSQKYNPCFGQQVAIDTGGEIKPCLWSDDVLGNILKDDLKDMIIAGRFDRYWEITKDKIETCKDCEKRYACRDCRVSSVRQSGSFEKKPAFCNYDPYLT